MTQRRLRFGVLGTGNIARQFAEGVAGSGRCEITAVGSRQTDSAREFAQAYGIQVAHGSYDALLADPTVEAVYVSLPNTMHHEWTIRSLESGKHVLCEKPIACDIKEAQAMFDAARRHGRLLVEAFMYRSHPQTKAVLAEVHGGAIGRVKLIRASFCYCTRKIEGNIRFDPALAGGALMDIGCYCVDLARLITQSEPTDIHCTAKRHETGVDEYACGALGYADGTLVSFCCGMTVQTDNAALICGGNGYVRVPVPWKPPVEGGSYELRTMPPPRQDGQRVTVPQTRIVDISPAGPLYGMEADDFAAAVLGETEPVMSAEDSLSDMRVLDALRRSAGTL